MSPEELLTLDSVSAIFAIAQDYLDSNQLKVKSKWYRPLEPVSITDTLTSVTFVLDKVKTPLKNWGVLQSFTFHYERLSLSQVVIDSTQLAGDLPNSKFDILEGYLRRFGIPLDKDELEEGFITEPGLTTFEAKEGGYRWVGSSRLMITSFVRDLSEFIKIDNVVTDFSPQFSSEVIGHDIIEHLNRSNKFRGVEPLTYQHIQICTPLTEETFSDKINTRIKLKARGGLYHGEDYVYYRRKSFQETWRKPVEIQYEGQVSVFEALGVISEKLGCTLSELDFVSDELITPPGRHTPTDIVLTFKPASMGFVGELKVRFHD